MCIIIISCYFPLEDYYTPYPYNVIIILSRALYNTLLWYDIFLPETKRRYYHYDYYTVFVCVPLGHEYLYHVWPFERAVETRFEFELNGWIMLSFSARFYIFFFFFFFFSRRLFLIREEYQYTCLRLGAKKR